MKKTLGIVVPLWIFVAALFIFQCLFLLGVVPTESMEPAIEAGSVVIASRLFGRIEIGDVLVFRYEGQLLLKRVAALGGDTVWIDGQVYTVPSHHFLMLGDNRENSWDSRYWTNPYIPEENVIGKVIGK